MKKNSKMSKIDKIVTWVIIWSAVAWVVWLSKTKKWQEIKSEMKQKSVWFFGKIKRFYWKTMITFLKFFNKK